MASVKEMFDWIESEFRDLNVIRTVQIKLGKVTQRNKEFKIYFNKFMNWAWETGYNK